LVTISQRRIFMGDTDTPTGGKPTEGRGGTTPDAREIRAKGSSIEAAATGIVPAELGGSDAPREVVAKDSDLDDSVLGRPAGSDEPATEEGVDLAAGDNADATSDEGPAIPKSAEPDLKDIAAARTNADKHTAGSGDETGWPDEPRSSEHPRAGTAKDQPTDSAEG
jgi:hypothetical protein